MLLFNLWYYWYVIIFQFSVCSFLTWVSDQVVLMPSTAISFWSYIDFFVWWHWADSISKLICMGTGEESTAKPSKSSVSTQVSLPTFLLFFSSSCPFSYLPLSSVFIWTGDTYSTIISRLVKLYAGSGIEYMIDVFHQALIGALLSFCIEIMLVTNEKLYL